MRCKNVNAIILRPLRGLKMTYEPRKLRFFPDPVFKVKGIGLLPVRESSFSGEKVKEKQIATQ